MFGLGMYCVILIGLCAIINFITCVVGDSTKSRTVAASSFLLVMPVLVYIIKTLILLSK